MAQRPVRLVINKSIKEMDSYEKQLMVFNWQTALSLQVRKFKLSLQGVETKNRQPYQST